VTTALISDVHSNLEALTAVLSHIRAQDVTQIYCLGDIIGYGPNPRECVDRIRRCQVTVMGNHDQAVLFDPDGFNPVALKAIYWTREQLDEGGGGPSAANRRWDFLGELPPKYQEPGRLFVHGSSREPTNEYVFPEDIYNRRKMDALFERIDHLCFQGHTHIPGIFTADNQFITPEECDHEFRFTDDKAMINVGSVGQPRDGDTRACYCVLKKESVVFHRVDYDKDATAKKIYSQGELDNMLGDRLLEGR